MDPAAGTLVVLARHDMQRCRSSRLSIYIRPTGREKVDEQEAVGIWRRDVPVETLIDASKVQSEGSMLAGLTSTRAVDMNGGISSSGERALVDQSPPRSVEDSQYRFSDAAKAVSSVRMTNTASAAFRISLDDDQSCSAYYGAVTPVRWTYFAVLASSSICKT